MDDEETVVVLAELEPEFTLKGVKVEQVLFLDRVRAEPMLHADVVECRPGGFARGGWRD